MIEIDIPGNGTLLLHHLVCDYNGTLALDGELIPGVGQAIEAVSRDLTVHVITADTFGTVAGRLAGLPCKIHVLPPGDQDRGKLDYVRSLGAERCACIGNGKNDRLMLEAAALGIAVILEEGAFSKTVWAADIVSTDILRAMELLMNPLRLTATLRC